MLEHRHDALGRGRDDGQAVREPALEERLERVLERSHVDRARADSPVRAGAASGQACRHLRVARAARAPGPHLGQAVEVELRARGRGQLGHARAVQALHATALLAGVEEQQRRHRVGVEARRQLKPGVQLGDRVQPDAARLLRRLGGFGLGEDPHRRAGRRRGVEYREDLVAHGTVVLDQREQFGHANRL